MSETSDYDRIAQTAYTRKVELNAYKIRLDPMYQPWRNNCLRRDKNRCKCCKSKINLHVHHIYEWQNYPLVRFDKANGITLCASCHKKAHIYYDKPKVNKPRLFLVRKHISPPKQDINFPDVILTIKTFMGNNNTVSSPYERANKKRRKWLDRQANIKRKRRMKQLVKRSRHGFCSG